METIPNDPNSILQSAKNSNMRSPLIRGIQPGWKRNLHSVRKYEPQYGLNRSIDVSIPIIYEQPSSVFDSRTNRSVRQIDSIVSFNKSKDSKSKDKAELNDRMKYMQKLYNKKMNRNADLVLDDYLVKVFKEKKP